MYRIAIRYDLAPSRKDIKKAIERALAKEQSEQRIRKIQSVVCPEHKLPAKVTVQRGGLQVAVCCRKLEAAIREELEPG